MSRSEGTNFKGKFYKVNINIFGWNFSGLISSTFPTIQALFRKNRAISNVPQNIEAKKEVTLNFDLDLWNFMSS